MIAKQDKPDLTASERRLLSAFLQAAAAFDAKHNKDQASALKQLRKEGMITRAGNLSRRYRD